jgi:hypothetical protein
MSPDDQAAVKADFEGRYTQFAQWRPDRPN